MLMRAAKGWGFSALGTSTVYNAIAAGTELEGNGPGDVAVYVW